MSIKCIPYKPTHADVWNNFLDKTNNGLFIHHRNYMEYHSDRFIDASLLVYDDSQLIGLFPASISADGTIISHAGLTYGGLLTLPGVGRYIRDIVKYVSDYYRDCSIIWKPVPHLFHKAASEADAFWLKELGYEVIDEKLSVYITGDLANTTDGLPMYLHTSKLRYYKSASKHLTYAVGNDDDLMEFWSILEDVLRVYHNTKPTHSLEEIQLLRNRFPDNILLYTAKHKGQIVAGIIIYKYKHVDHTQYLAASSLGRKLNALNWLVLEYYKDRKPKILNFGHSNEKNGELNWGLYVWKSRFGGMELIIRTYGR